MKNLSIIHKITKIVVDVSLIVGAILVVLVPFSINDWAKFFGYSSKDNTSLIVILILSGATALYLLWQVRNILKLVVQQNVFSEKTVIALRKIALGSLLIAIIYFFKFCFNFNIVSFLIIVVFLLATLIFLTLKDVFKEAIAYKEENEWTI